MDLKNKEFLNYLRDLRDHACKMKKYKEVELKAQRINNARKECIEAAKKGLTSVCSSIPIIKHYDKEFKETVSKELGVEVSGCISDGWCEDCGVNTTSECNDSYEFSWYDFKK